MGEHNDDICDVRGILVGHDTLAEGGTGCTVIRMVTPAVGSVDVRGGAPATRETDLLHPLCMMHEVHAILLTGGSAFGLDAAAGVMQVLEASDVGFHVGVTRVPIVPAAALFDLQLGSAAIRPDAAAGMRATLAARHGPVTQGTIGAGTGATVGKMNGPAFATKSGIGSASAQLPDEHVMGALIVVNAVGNIYDDQSGELIAGARDPSGNGWFAPSTTATGTSTPFTGANTSIGVIATDAPFSKVELAKIAQMAHDGLARVIRPVHTPFDGDAIFAVSTAHEVAPQPSAMAVGLAGALAAECMARAVVKAIRSATGLHGVPAISELPFAKR